MYAPTVRSLKFFKNYMRKKQADLLLLSLQDLPETAFSNVTPRDDTDTLFEARKRVETEAKEKLIGQLKRIKR